MPFEITASQQTSFDDTSGPTSLTIVEKIGGSQRRSSIQGIFQAAARISMERRDEIDLLPGASDGERE